MSVTRRGAHDPVQIVARRGRGHCLDHACAATARRRLTWSYDAEECRELSQDITAEILEKIKGAWRPRRRAAAKPLSFGATGRPRVPLSLLLSPTVQRTPAACRATS